MPRPTTAELDTGALTHALLAKQRIERAEYLAEEGLDAAATTNAAIASAHAQLSAALAAAATLGRSTD